MVDRQSLCVPKIGQDRYVFGLRQCGVDITHSINCVTRNALLNPSILRAPTDGRRSCDGCVWVVRDNQQPLYREGKGGRGWPRSVAIGRLKAEREMAVLLAGKVEQ